MLSQLTNIFTLITNAKSVNLTKTNRPSVTDTKYVTSARGHVTNYTYAIFVIKLLNTAAIWLLTLVFTCVRAVLITQYS